MFHVRLLPHLMTACHLWPVKLDGKLKKANQIKFDGLGRDGDANTKVEWPTLKGVFTAPTQSFIAPILSAGLYRW